LIPTVIGVMMLAASFLLHAAPGDLDRSLGTGGKAVNTMPNSTFSSLTAAALQSDQKIVLAGSSPFYGNASAFCLARLDTDGVPDVTFYETGKVLTPLTLTSAVVVVQTDGTIVLAGFCVRNATEGTIKPCVRRYLRSERVGGFAD
jgi:Domain of unknown function (DUF5122) beta-propeller